MSPKPPRGADIEGAPPGAHYRTGKYVLLVIAIAVAAAGALLYTQLGAASEKVGAARTQAQRVLLEQAGIEWRTPDPAASIPGPGRFVFEESSFHLALRARPMVVDAGEVELQARGGELVTGGARSMRIHAAELLALLAEAHATERTGASASNEEPMVVLLEEVRIEAGSDDDRWTLALCDAELRVGGGRVACDLSAYPSLQGSLEFGMGDGTLAVREAQAELRFDEYAMRALDPSRAADLKRRGIYGTWTLRRAPNEPLSLSARARGGWIPNVPDALADALCELSLALDAGTSVVRGIALFEPAGETYTIETSLDGVTDALRGRGSAADWRIERVGTDAGRAP